MNLIIPQWPAPDCVKAFSTVRSGGFSSFPYHGDTLNTGGLNFGLHVGDSFTNVRKNRALLTDRLPSEPVWLNQVHGATIVNAATCIGTPNADASFVNKKNIVCVVMTADCLPVLLCASDGTVVAAAHAGWRGLVAGVLENTVAAIRKNSDSDILAWLGPAIGPNAFEVGQEVRNCFVQKDSKMSMAFSKKKEGNSQYLANIYELARQTLNKMGVIQIYGGGDCTVSDPKRFYSYRRDRLTGRMATGIWIAT